MTPTDAHLKILSLIQKIPPGYVATYGDIAAAAGYPRRARWVGQVLRNSPLADDVPWHRVVNAQARISDRDGPGPRRQRQILEREGITFDHLDRIDLLAHRWRPRGNKYPPV